MNGREVECGTGSHLASGQGLRSFGHVSGAENRARIGWPLLTHDVVGLDF